MFVLVYINEGNNVKRFNDRKSYLPKDIINNYNVISNEKNFFDQAIDSGTKRYEEIRKLTTGRSEGHITGSLLDYDYVKDHYRLIAVDSSRQIRLIADPKSIQQIKFVGQLKKLDANDNPTDAGNNHQSMFVLTILEKMIETKLKFSEGSVTVL